MFRSGGALHAAVKASSGGNPRLCASQPGSNGAAATGGLLSWLNASAPAVGVVLSAGGVAALCAEIFGAYHTRNLATKEELGKVRDELGKKLDTLIGLASGTTAHVEQLDKVQDKLLQHLLPPKQR